MCRDAYAVCSRRSSTAIGLCERSQFTPIQQAHFGSRDLTFGARHLSSRVRRLQQRRRRARLADYLASVRPESWTVADLDALRDMDLEDRADELEFAREWFPALVEMYRRRRPADVLSCMRAFIERRTGCLRSRFAHFARQTVSVPVRIR